MIPDYLKRILPDTADVNTNGHLTIGGCDMADLASEFGSPLYVFDEATVRGKCREYQLEFRKRYSDTTVLYAGKAFLNQALARILNDEEMGLDVVSGGEMFIAHSAGFPMKHTYFHGNNKSPEEIEQAIRWDAGRIVVDNLHELSLVNDIAGKIETTQDILLRLSPGIDPHTHAKTTTGVVDSKFGFPIVTGQAEEAIIQAMAAPHVNLKGLHVHLGSPIFETEPYRQAVEVVLQFAASMKHNHGFQLLEFSPGGGFAIPYTRDDPYPQVTDYAEAISNRLWEVIAELALDPPRLIIEPGRSIIGRAGVALYHVGGNKDVPGIRRYVSLNGGMSDNIRPAFYDSRYEALVANNMQADPEEEVTLAGKHCESGDILIRDVALPKLKPGDVIAVPVSGAYCLSMASNYNASARPAVIMVKEGKARLIQRRETYEDLISRDV